jgi:hypothetical protein
MYFSAILLQSDGKKVQKKRKKANADALQRAPRRVS